MKIHYHRLWFQLASLFLITTDKIRSFQTNNRTLLNIIHVKKQRKKSIDIHRNNNSRLSRTCLRSNDHDSHGDRELVQSQEHSRRRFIAGSLLTIGIAVVPPPNLNNGCELLPKLFFASDVMEREFSLPSTFLAYTVANAATVDEIGKLRLKSSPVNRRSGITVFQAEEMYSVKFVTYLSRFLINFDADCQKWWFARAADIPRKSTVDQVEQIRLRQFGAFSASVEVGLQEYLTVDGPEKLLKAFLKRYCPDGEDRDRLMEGKSSSAAENELKEIREARRQIALLFGLLEKNQPVEELTRLLAVIDNASIDYVAINDRGRGYAPGYGSPTVTFPQPEAGEKYETAKGVAKLRPSGRLLRIDFVDHGAGYKSAPDVIISPPKTDSLDSDSRTATAKAELFVTGPYKGAVARITLTDPGKGYTEKEEIIVTIDAPDVEYRKGGKQAIAKPVRELEIGSVEITEGGSGYAAEKALAVTIDPPPVTARVDLNDPILLESYMKKSSTGGSNVSSMADDIYEKVANAALGATGSSKCIGRACYDKPVILTAYARAEMDSYASFRNPDADDKYSEIERAVEARGANSVRTTSSGATNTNRSRLAVGGLQPSSKQLTMLLPSGYGLQFNKNLQRYVWALGQSFEEIGGDFMNLSQSSRPLDAEFGPRGRSPIEQERVLDIETYLRFGLSGAVCCSIAHLVLTPLDVVKTKIQTDPRKYSGFLSSFKKVYDEGGVESFVTGWEPTFFGFFIWGGIGYTVVEATRRALEGFAGADAANIEVPIIMAASSLSAIAGSFIIAPTEAVRIRSVAQPDYAPSAVGVLERILQEEGVLSLFSAVPVFLLKEIPFAIAKFTVFDLTSEALFTRFPVAKEDIQLSLLVTLVAGSVGGIFASIVSNPADVTISTLKKSNSKAGFIDTAKMLVDQNGWSALLYGLGVRCIFYPILVSIQFLLYDTVRFALGIGADDLKLYLDVLGGALSESGGPV